MKKRCVRCPPARLPARASRLAVPSSCLGRVQLPPSRGRSWGATAGVAPAFVPRSKAWPTMQAQLPGTPVRPRPAPPRPPLARVSHPLSSPRYAPARRQPAFEWIYGWRPGDSHDPPKLPNRVASAEDEEAARAATAGRAGRKRVAKAAPPPAAADPAKRPRSAGEAGGSAGAAGAGATASGGAAGAAAAAAPGAFPDPMSMAAAGMAGMGAMGPFGMPMAGFGPMMMPPGEGRPRALPLLVPVEL